jgi:hypothetical protein
VLQNVERAVLISGIRGPTEGYTVWKEALLPGQNSGHNGVARVARDPHTHLPALTERHFLHFYIHLHGPDDARQANVHLSPEVHIHVSLHVLRPTLLRKVANEKSVHYAMELSGHRSDRYI